MRHVALASACGVAGFNPRPALRPGDAAQRLPSGAVDVWVSIRARP